MKHCCNAMAHWSENQCETHANRFECPDALVHWSGNPNDYGLIIHDGGSSVIGIPFCPWCGSKLAAKKAGKSAFPVVQAAQAAEEEWAPKLAERAGVSPEVFRSAPIRHMHFPPEAVHVELMDGSVVQFKHAFALHWSEKRAIAVFTEHCGHHVFPDAEASVRSIPFEAGTQ